MYDAVHLFARALTDDVWICAPEYEQSGASRALTLSDPIRVRKLDDRCFAVEGTPTDCVMMAVQQLMHPRDRAPLTTMRSTGRPRTSLISVLQDWIA